MTVKELYDLLDKMIPRALSADWDNDGLACLPEKSREVRRVLIALDATAPVVERAVAGGFDLLLTHHPLLFSGVKELTPEKTVPRKLLELARAGVAAASFHTRLDASKGGVNDLLCELLGITDTQPFAPDGEIPCGRVGTLPEPVEAAEFAKRVCAVLNTPAVNMAGAGKVQTIAVIGGEGGDFVGAAMEAGADLLLAGRIGYHRMLDAAEEGLVLIEAGHYKSELPVCHVLDTLVRMLAPDVETEVMDAPTIQVVLA